MITAKSFFNFARFRSTYKNVIHRKRGTLAFLTVLGFVFLSLQYILAIVEYNRSIAAGWGTTHFELFGPSGAYNGFALFSFFCLEFVAILSVVIDLFGYMHNKRSTDVYHSLPLTRDELYLANSAAGMTIISIPIIINFLIVAACSFLVPGQNVGMILLEMLCWLVIAFATFAIAAFCAVNAGTVFDASIFSLGTAGSLALVYITMLGMASNFIYGVNFEEQMINAYKLSPVSVIIARQFMNPYQYYSVSTELLQYYKENNMAVLLWLLAGVAIFLLGMLCYRRRKSELAEMVGTKGALQIYLRTAGTFVGGVVMAAIYCAMWDIESGKVSFLVAVAFLSIVVYFIGEVLLSRTVKSIPKSFKSAIITAAMVTVASGLIINGGFGIENYVPKSSDVDSVHLKRINSYLGYNSEMTLKNDEAIELILAAHNAQIEAHRNGEERFSGITYDSSVLHPEYTLKNGKVVKRNYYDVAPEAVRLLAELETTQEFIQNRANVYRATPDMIYTVTVQNILGTEYEEKGALTAQQKQELLSALQKDLLSRDMNELLQGETGIAYLNIGYRYKLVNGKDPLLNNDKAYIVQEDKSSIAVTVEASAVVAAEFTALESEPEQERYYYDVFNVIITDSFTNTLKALENIGFDASLKNDFSDVSMARAGILNYIYTVEGGAIVQTSNSYQSRYDADEIYGEEFMAELSKADFDAIKGSLTNFIVNDNKTTYVTIMAVGENNSSSSLFFAPLESLPEAAKRDVCRKALDYYDRESLIKAGYTYLD